MVESGIAVGIIMGLSQIFKNVGLPTKYIPVINLIMGVIIGVGTFDVALQQRVLQGLILGLTASGLFDQTKPFKKH